MSGIDFLVKNINEQENSSWKSLNISVFKNLRGENKLLIDTESLLNSYNQTLENVKILNSIYLIYFHGHFKKTGCSDLLLKTLWIMFIISKNKFQNDQIIEKNCKILIDFLFAKLNIFFGLETYSNYYKTYFMIHYCFLVEKISSTKNFSNTKLTNQLNQVYFFNEQQKEFFDELFSKIFIINSLLDQNFKEEDYLDFIFQNPQINIEANSVIQKEEELIPNISIFDTNEMTLEKTENNISKKYIFDLSLNEDNGSKIEINLHPLKDNNDLKQCIGLGKGPLEIENINKTHDQSEVYFFNNLNNNLLIKGINNKCNVENNNLLFDGINKFTIKLESTNKITELDYSKILYLLTKFYKKNLFSENEIDELLIYDNINLDKYLESSKIISPLSNNNSSHSCPKPFGNYFFISKEERIETPYQNTNEYDKYNQFIENLSSYLFIDTYYLIKKYELNLYFQNNQLEDFSYCLIYQTFYDKFLKKNKCLYRDIDKIKSSYDKNIFFKLVDDYLSIIFIKYKKEIQKKEEEDPIIESNKENNKTQTQINTFSFSEFYLKFGFDIQFFENMFIIAYFLYLNLLLVGKPNLDEIIYNFIKTINHYQNVNYNLLFFHIDNLIKLNYSSSIKRIFKNLNNLIVSLALVSKDSCLLKKALVKKVKESIEIKQRDISCTNNNDKKEKDFNSLPHKEIDEKKIKTIVKRIYLYAASKFNNFLKKWKMKNELYEKIWTLFKFMISDYIDLIADKSLDFIIVLCLFLTLYSFEDKFDLFENKIEGTPNKYINIVDNRSEIEPEKFFKIIVFEYIEANRNDYSRITKTLLMKAFSEELINKSENKEYNTYETTSCIDHNQSINLSNEKEKLCVQLISELKKYSNIIFYDTDYFIDNYKPKYSILYDESSFNKCKNLLAYEMEMIYSFTPKTKSTKPSCDIKNLNNLENIQNKFNQSNLEEYKSFIRKNINENGNFFYTQSNESLSNKSNNCFFSRQMFKNNTNSNNIKFLNTKRIQKITTPISNKIINSSPFKEKTNLLFKKNNSAFRNLKNEFEGK